MKNKHTGGCYCGNIYFEMELSNPLKQYSPRECDCDFCQKHGAQYISDKDGKLIIKITEAQLLSKFRQGSMSAEFLICKSCGVLIAGCYQEDDKIYASINTITLKDKSEIGQSIVVSPQKLAVNDKIDRWKKIWFRDVKIQFENNKNTTSSNLLIGNILTPVINIQESTIGDINQLAIHHRKMFEEIWEKNGLVLDSVKAKEVEFAYSEKLKNQILTGSCKAWVVKFGNQIVASGAVSIVSLTPVPNDINHNVAFLHSMYTENEFRGRKLANQILEKAIQYCKTNGINRVILNASNAGKPIYEKLGFVATPEAMKLFVN